MNDEIQDDILEDVVETDEEGMEAGSQNKLKELRAKLKLVEAEKLQYLTNWQKDKAEFINARKRDQEAKEEFAQFASAKVVEDILPVLDSFDMAMGGGGNKEQWESVSKEWRAGVESIQQQLKKVLEKHGVKAFGTIGESFDPSHHHSIATVPTEDKDASHTIAEVLQRGYSMQGKVIRPALVKVFE